MTDEFPAELVERCAKAMWDCHKAFKDSLGKSVWVWEGVTPDVRSYWLDNAIAVLRASGYAELVAALEKARDELESWYDAKNVLATINAALAAAGHKQGGGDTIITKGAYRGDKRLLDDMYGGTDD
jgi:hypothetical protein